ncbi:carbamoyltransferase HypF [Dethiothermospora halolimnae]|uniref:carbamoyltransferase HypF n=1 Tax=Dethiothermospora halolimnae TaxID=3114390 RepID=UPI003CCC1F8C
MGLVRKYIKVKGVVQGVGFRPFVYKLALDNDLKGWVKNTSMGVYIDIEGKKSNIDKFIYTLENDPPSLSNIESISIEDKNIIRYKNFSIKNSAKEDESITLISPDMGICDKCLEDIKDIKNTRYRYPFTNCTNCGPRFSIIRELPYDRVSTTMEEFKMCDNCNKEYNNPLDRRFHAQPNGCPKCGPKVQLMDNQGKEIPSYDPMKRAIKLIKEGNIVAVKGLGGFHLACDGKNQYVIDKLRNRKYRPTKPFALMMKDIRTVKKYSNLNNIEEEIISSNKKPILLLNKGKEKLPHNIAYNSNKLGVMLPYTPLHYLLFEDNIEVLVLTSGNINGMPICYENKEALKSLKNIADYFLIHNRKIHIPVDDSVVKVVLNKERVIRNARGYAPLSMTYKNTTDILACGSHLKNTFALSKNDNIFISQYMGDIESVESYKNFKSNLAHFKKIYNIIPKVIAYDYHPNYFSTEYIKNQDTQKMPVQHHHSHIVSCMFENKVKDRVIGIAFDGIGYGTDKSLWGGEFLICNYKNFNRVGHINYIKMPGGDKATKEPWKMAISYMDRLYGSNIYRNIPKHFKDKDTDPLLAMIKNNINSPKCSSIGRLFDGVSAIVGYGNRVTYEGEGAIYLENIADKNETRRYGYDIETIDEKHIVNTDNIIKGVVEDINKGVSPSIISKKFHNTIIDFSFKVCGLIRDRFNIDKVALSGGVFQNEILLIGIYKKLVSKGFKVYTHKKIPCNDSGISLGQLIIANENYRK